MMQCDHALSVIKTARSNRWIEKFEEVNTLVTETMCG